MPNPLEYGSPLSSRYCSEQAKSLASDASKWTYIRKVWLAVIKGQIEGGLLDSPPSKSAINSFEKNISQFDWELIGELEKELKHDVMAHIGYISSYLAPDLGENIHIAMTSDDATSNGEILWQNEMLRHLLANASQLLVSSFKNIKKYKDLAMLGETHLQPATAVTLGKRIAMWVGPIMNDVFEIETLLQERTLKGVRGATGTYEALLKLCEGDLKKVRKLGLYLEKELGMKITWMVPGQTAPRNWDIEFVHRCNSLGSNLAKFATDFRHLARTGELGEPRGRNQVGSSAMPWKQNPMKAERLNALARLLPGHYVSACMTQQVQGLERTLDDSAARRVYISESFLLVDACLKIANELLSNFNVSETNISTRLNDMLPFLVTEEILAKAVKSGLPREQTHRYLMELSKSVYQDLSSGAITKNDLLERIKKDPDSPLKGVELSNAINPSDYTGNCSQLCEDFLQSKQVKKIYELNQKNPTKIEKMSL